MLDVCWTLGLDARPCAGTAAVLILGVLIKA
jgi:hypothetical protein